jgi:flagellar hook-basal body complex protein FliE
MAYGAPAIGSLTTPLLDSATRGGATGGAQAPAETSGIGSFASMLQNRLESLDAGQQAGNQAAQDIATNRVEDVAQAMLQVEKANVSLQFATQVRNKAIEAYQEILRMQI